MNRDQFASHLLMAVVFTGIALAMFSASSLLLGFSLGMLATGTGVAALWLVWLFFSRAQRRGVTLAILGWLLLSLVLLLVNAGAVLTLLAFSGLIWLVRSGLRYDTPLRTFMDAAVSLLAVAAAIAVAVYSHSLGLAFWTYFFIQALVYLVPEPASRRVPAVDNPFAVASRQAEQALNKIGAA